MKFADGLIKAYETKWSYINTFTVQISFAQTIKNQIGWTQQDETDVNLNIVGIDTPQFQNQPIDTFIGNRWKIHNGRDELYMFSITFRDQNQMTLYSKFVKAYMFQKEQYFDDARSTITISKDPDYYDESLKKFMVLEDTLIAGISQLQFNNSTEAQIAEFSVQFKCASPKVY